MRILTQNLQWGGGPVPGSSGVPRLPELVRLVSSFNADVVVFTEFKSGELGERLIQLMREAAYPYFFCDDQPPRVLGTAIASRIKMEPLAHPIPAVHEPWRSVATAIDDIKLFGYYFPLREPKQVYWDWVLETAAHCKDEKVLLVGDFNTGLALQDEAGETFDCQASHIGLRELGFVDTWRAAYPQGRDYTWYSSGRNGFRLDYVWASKALAPFVQRTSIEHESRLRLLSDHSAVLTDLH